MDATSSASQSALALHLRVVVGVRLVLGQKVPLVRWWAEEHLCDLDPVCGVVATQKRLELVAAAVRVRALVECCRQALEQANRNVAMLEAQRLAEEASVTRVGQLCDSAPEQAM